VRPVAEVMPLAEPHATAREAAASRPLVRSVQPAGPASM